MKFALKTLLAFVFTTSLTLPTFAESPKEEAIPEKEPQQAWLGVYVKPLPQSLRAQLDIHKSSGLLVEDIVSESPAELAGIQPFDVLLAYGDQRLFNRDQLQSLVLDSTPETKVEFQIIRTGKTMTLPVKLGSKAMDSKPKAPWEGLELSEEIRKMLQGVAENPEIRAALSEAQGEISELIQSVSESLPTEAEIKENISKVLESLKEGSVSVKELEMLGGSEDDPDSIMRQTRILSDATEVNYSDSYGDIQVKSTNDSVSARLLDPEGKVIYEGPLNDDALKTLSERDRERLKGLLEMHKIPVAEVK